jgi:hypothetical protein
MKQEPINFQIDPLTTCPVVQMYPFLDTSHQNDSASLVVMSAATVGSLVVLETDEILGIAGIPENQEMPAIPRTTETLDHLSRSAPGAAASLEIGVHPLTTRKAIAVLNCLLAQYRENAIDRSERHGRLECKIGPTKALVLKLRRQPNHGSQP